MSFNNFDLSAEVVRGVQAMGFAEPTPIQLRAFPIILAGKDLIGTAQTGTGKTAAFALPILTLLGHHGKFRCLVLEPTRELADDRRQFVMRVSDDENAAIQWSNGVPEKWSIESANPLLQYSITPNAISPLPEQ